MNNTKELVVSKRRKNIFTALKDDLVYNLIRKIDPTFSGNFASLRLFNAISTFQKAQIIQKQSARAFFRSLSENEKLNVLDYIQDIKFKEERILGDLKNPKSIITALERFPEGTIRDTIISWHSSKIDKTLLNLVTDERLIKDIVSIAKISPYDYKDKIQDPTIRLMLKLDSGTSKQYKIACFLRDKNKSMQIDLCIPLLSKKYWDTLRTR